DGRNLSAYKTTSIHVIGPPITNLKATVTGNSVSLNWDKSVCSQTVGYNIYRAIGCVKFVPGPCETGVPATSGFIYVGTTTTTNFIDSTVVPGLYYSYLVDAVYPVIAGSPQGIASNDTCVFIRRDIPLLTNVSVDSTAAGTGRIFVRWIKPKSDSLDFDTTKYTGPYTYTLSRAQGINGTGYTQVAKRTYPYFGSATDTTFKDVSLNTSNTGYRYKLNFFYKDSLPVGTAPTASSIFLTAKPGNNIIDLSWASNIPWTDSAYMIYRMPPLGTSYSFLTTVKGNIHSYTDTALTNTKTYCYYVKSMSYYADTAILHPLVDSSEEVCSAPKDTIPPCAPKLAVSAQCNTFQDSLLWNNPDHTCKGIKNTIEYYNIYYSSVQGGDMQLIKTINNVNDTIFVNDSLKSVAGCYAVTAVDSFGNESKLVPVCVDNCPQYTLPNVFTPNGDNQNDFFTPILPFRYIKSIDINIFNRWGQIMFHTNDPMINWDGKDQTTHGLCPDGVYYYICVVNEIRVTGVQPITLKGFVQIIR
ncbi:MAG TPA: gliding motility-associated C-terminal domain-containing protein, partial [Bacteroidia bacterium]|nr:gliding motility-associated C-terminal domain-containing protein [Bacteroidia bacterium]